MSEKITYIYPEDLVGLEQDKDGNYKVPDGFGIYKVPTLQEKMDNVIQEIKRIEALEEPSDKELIIWARESHPYYDELYMLPFYKKQVEDYEKQLKDGSSL